MGSIEIVVFLILILCVLGYIKIRIKKTQALADDAIIKAMMNEYFMKFKQDTIVMINLDFESANYGEIDALISNESEKFIVILRGPEWLFALKKRMWNQHEVINRDEVPYLTSKIGIVKRTKKGHIQYFKNQREFLEYHRARSEFIGRLKKILINRNYFKFHVFNM
jgi:hypothetical protein